MVCSFCQQGECINPAHAVTDPPARDARGWRIAPGLSSAWRRLIAEYCIDLSDPYTLEKLNEIYYRSGGLNFGSGTEALWTHKRAAGGELHTVIRYAREFPEDERHNILIRFVPESRVRGSRTPDFLVLHLDGEELRSEHVEVRTLTQAKRRARVQRPGGDDRLPGCDDRHPEDARLRARPAVAGIHQGPVSVRHWSATEHRRAVYWSRIPPWTHEDGVPLSRRAWVPPVHPSSTRR